MSADLAEGAGELRIVLLVAIGRTRRFAAILAEALAASLPARVDIALVDSDRDLDGASEAAERLERRLLHTSGAAGPAVLDGQPADASAPPPDLLIDLAGRPDIAAEMQPALTLRPLWNGEARLGGMLASMSGETPATIAVERRDAAGCRIMHGAVVALPDRTAVSRILDTACGRATALLLEAAEACLAGKSLPDLPSFPEGPSRVRLPPAATICAGYAGRLMRRVTRPLLHRGDWSVFYRPATRGLPKNADARAFTMLSSPPDRYYADPFLFEEGGSPHLFVEDFDRRAGRGSIAVAALGADGRAGPVSAALQRSYHLSYPLVFREGGRIYMLPETSANGTVELYEAVRFPHEWRLAKVLLSDIDASDATLHRDEQGTWWMFASIARFGGSTEDSLCLFFADALGGPWRPHPQNPVKNDARSSRPAGPLMIEEGQLLRPAQDCSRRYGGAISWCVVEELSRTAFHERTIGRLTSDPASGFAGPHTFCRSSGYEAVDFTHDRRRAFMPRSG